MPILRSGFLVVLLSLVGLWSCGAEISGGLSKPEMPSSEDKPIDEPDDGNPLDESTESDAGVETQGDGSAVLTWVAPTQNEDNSKLTDLKGFRVYFRLPGGLIKTTDLGNVLTHTVTGLPSGVVEFWVTAVNQSGVESKPSERKSKNIP